MHPAPADAPLVTAALRAAIKQPAPRAVSVLISDAIGEPVTIDVLRYAVLECGCDRSVVRLLLGGRLVGHDMSRTAIYYSVPDLDRWRRGEKAGGSAREAWLGARLKEYRCGKLRLRKLVRNPDKEASYDWIYVWKEMYEEIEVYEDRMENAMRSL